MKENKETKRALIPSVLAVILCVAMLIGTTFAWFTDTASTSVNKIEAGKLDVALEVAKTWTKNDSSTVTVSEWEPAEGKTLQFLVNGQIPDESTTILWEPGCTYELPQLRICNNGNLALKYKVVISGIQGNAKLNEAITWTTTRGTETETLGTEHSLAAKTTDETNTDYYDTFTISGHMKEDAGNEYQGLSIDGIAITVYAKQDTVEFDSTTKDYDANAAYDLERITDAATGNLDVTKTTTTDSSGAEVVTITTTKVGTVEGDSVSVKYPSGTKLKTDTTVTGTTDQKAAVDQSLTYTSDKLSAEAASVTLESNQAVASYKLELPVDEENETLVEVSTTYTKYLTNVKIYHSGVELGRNAAKEDAKEYFTYDYSTGKLTLYLEHASSIDIVYDKPGTTTTVTTRAQLEAALADTSISTIKLGSDIPLGTSMIRSIEVSRAVTIDFNGKTLGIVLDSMDSKDNVDSGKLVLYNSDNSGTAYSMDTTNSSQSAAVVANNNATVTIESGRYTGTSSVIYCQTTGGVVINGGTFVGTDAVDVVDSEKGTVTINGGTFKAASGACVRLGSPSIITINGGTFRADSTLFYVGRYAYGSSSVINVAGGTFTVAENGSLITRYNGQSTEGYLSITGGTFNVDPSAYVAVGYQAVKNETAGTWTVTAK